MAGNAVKVRTLVAHCDWSKDARKRWMALAERRDDGWSILPPEPVVSGQTLLADLSRRTRGGLMVGFDFPIGLPVAYGERTGFDGFTDALRRLGTDDWSEWYSVCGSADEISLRRPFYPARPGGTGRDRLFAGLGLDGAQRLRRCERGSADRQAACMLFWTLGGNQVGKGAISGWREVIVPSIDSIGLWPFAGTLADLDEKDAPIVVETYPGEVYGHLGIPRRPLWSKRAQSGRAGAGFYLLDWMRRRPVEGPAVAKEIRDGFGARADGEDRFDAVVGLFGMLDVLMGHRGEGTPDLSEVYTWEGWILGQRDSPGANGKPSG